jgi:hypothetical protein
MNRLVPRRGVRLTAVHPPSLAQYPVGRFLQQRIDARVQRLVLGHRGVFALAQVDDLDLLFRALS